MLCGAVVNAAQQGFLISFYCFYQIFLPTDSRYGQEQTLADSKCLFLKFGEKDEGTCHRRNGLHR